MSNTQTQYPHYSGLRPPEEFQHEENARYKTREEWLEECVRQFRGIFETHNLALPPRLHLSCGLPSRGALSETRQNLSETWHPEATADGVHQIFISPLVEDGLGAASLLLRELVRASLPSDTKNGPQFKAACGKLGLTSGKPKSASPGPELTKTLEDVILNRLGKYPHAALIPPGRKEGEKGKGRMLKISCENGHEPYVLRGSRKVINLGLPDCPVCGEPLKTPEGEEEGNENE